MNSAGELSSGVAAIGEPITFRFGSRTIESMAGQSLLAALLGAGEKLCRTTESGAPRGMFCGMGVCQDCIVCIQGTGNQRACMTLVQDGMQVEPLAARPEPISAPGARETLRLSPDVLVIGGGPAGLAAAAVAAEAGLDVLLIDERAKLGGQFYKQPADGFEVDEMRIDKQFRNGRALIQRAQKAGVHYLSGATVWAAFGPDEIVAGSETSTIIVKPQRIVLATGAYELGVPMPGWTLPGFMTSGAAQTLLRSYQSAPGKRVLLSGNGPLNLQVAAELVRAGVSVVALAETARRPGRRSAVSLAVMAATAPDLLRDGLAYQRELRRAGVPIFYRHAIVRAEGANSVERAVIAEIDDDGRPVVGSETSFEVDAVCVGFGFLPSNEIARSLGCAHRFDTRRGHLAAEVDGRRRSSVSRVWIAGDSAGLGGARTAQASGLIAGADVAEDLGRKVRDRQEIEAAVSAEKRASRFQSALWTLFRAPKIIDQFAEADTLLCRCEEIPLASILQAIEDGDATAGAVKRRTRSGMGRCQGRYCGSLIVDLVARHRKSSVDEFAYFAPRMPFKPMPISAVTQIDAAPAGAHHASTEDA